MPMYLKTPKRYTAKGQKRQLLNLRWLWLYIMFPIVLIPTLIVWNMRGDLSGIVGNWVNNIQFNGPTATPTILAADYGRMLSNAFQSGNMSRAVSLLKGFDELVPNDPSFHSLTAQLMVLRQAYSGDALSDDFTNQMLQAGESAINADPENSQGWISEALVLDYLQEPQAALPYALHAADLNSQDPWVPAVTGEIYLDLGKYDDAEKMIDQAITLGNAGNIIETRAALSHAHWVKGHLLADTSANGDDAIKEYENAWNIATSDPVDPRIPIGYIAVDLSISYSNNDQDDRAIEVITKAIQRDKDDPILQYRLGATYLRQGQTDKARQYFEACNVLDPNQMKCLYNQALLAYHEQNYKKTIELGQKLVDLGSKVAAHYLLIGQADVASNLCTNAIDVLHQGIGFADNDEDRYSFQQLLQQCGDTSGLIIATPTPDNTETPTPIPSATPKGKRK